MNETWTTCLLHHHQPTRALTRALVCGKHDRAIREDLIDLDQLYPLLDHVLEPGSVQADDLIRYSGRIDPPAAVRLEVVALRDRRTTWDPDTDRDAVDVLGVLAGWAQIVREQRRLAPPDGPPTVTGEAATLRVHQDWITAQAWVDEYAKDLHRAAAAVRHACGEYERSTRVGNCTALLDGADAPCGGPLYPDRYGMMQVRCARCGTVWDEDDLRRLGLVLDSTG